ncbi:MAG: ABC transporter substrate-binding protein [Acidimicrobiia bacterium]
MRRRVGVSLSALAAGAALAAGLAQPQVSLGGEAPKGGTLRVSRFSDVDFVDPALAYASWSWPIGYAMCAKLFNYPDAAGVAGTRVTPEVVDGHTVSKDRRTYTFQLRRTFRFHTGAAVTARSFADAINRLAQPKLESPAARYLREIAGAAAVLDGKAQSISGVRVLGRYRLQIRLTKPVGDFTARLTMPFFCPILPNTPVDPRGNDNPAGSGPYYVAERVVNQRIVLKRNPYYRGNRPANVDQIVWTIGTSREDCLLAVEQNRLDYCGASGLPPTAHRRLTDEYGINRPGGQLLVSPSLTTWYLAFNHDRLAFKGREQVPLKKAINYAIDRPAMSRAFGYLTGKRTDQLLPPALARPANIYPLRGADPVTARRWLARATHQPRELVVYANNSSTGAAIAQVLAFNLRQIGIEADVRYFDTVTLAAKAETPGEPFDLIYLGWGADYADGAAFFVPLLGNEGQQSGTHFTDPRVTSRIEAVERLTGEARRNAWADLDVDLMRDNPPWAPVTNTQSVTLVSRSVGCVVLHPIYGLDFAAVCKKR